MLGEAVRNKRVNSEDQAKKHHACQIQTRIIGLLPYHIYFCVCTCLLISLLSVHITSTKVPQCSITTLFCWETQWTIIPRYHRKLCWGCLWKIKCTIPQSKTRSVA